MATAFKPTDSLFVYSPTPPPNIRVAFIAGEATTAVGRALAALPAEVRDSTLEEIADTVPVIGRDLYPLPPLDALVSSGLRSLAERYKASFLDKNEDGDDTAAIWDAIAREIAAYTPTGPADTSAMIMLGLHYLHPELLDGKLAIDTTGFETSAAGEILIACANDLVSRPTPAALPAPSLAAWNVAREAFEQADAAFDACSMEDEERLGALGDDRYNALINLLVTPAPTGAELAYKLSLYNSSNGRHFDHGDEIGRALEADARRLAGFIDTTLDEAWSQAVTVFGNANAAASVSGLSDEQVDRLAVTEFAAGQAIMALPSRSIADVAAKLRIQMTLATMVENNDLVGIVADLDRLAGETIEIGAQNPDLVRVIQDLARIAGAGSTEAAR